MKSKNSQEQALALNQVNYYICNAVKEKDLNKIKTRFLNESGNGTQFLEKIILMAL